MKKKIKQELTADMAVKNARKQIIAVLIIGLLLAVIDLAISSGDPDTKIVQSDGYTYILRPGENQEMGHLPLHAKVYAEHGVIEKKVNLSVKPYMADKKEDKDEQEIEQDSAATEQERIDYEVRNIISGVNSDTNIKKVQLPAVLDTGEKISWETAEGSESNLLIISILTLLIAFFIYKNRFAEIDRQRRKNRESVIRQLPEFVNRLVLLLNAGLVLTSAFEKSVEESFNFNDNEYDYFYGKLKEIYISCKTANGSMHKEFKAMAKESGIRELMRVSNIISDNIKKGVELTDKLQAESEILWLNRKKNCEEKSKLAETKMTLPLMIFLMVLVVITIAPALLEL